MSRANFEPKAINHTKGRWCTPATSQSMSAAAKWKQRPKSGACSPHQPTPSSRTVAWRARAEQLTDEPTLATDQAAGTWTTAQQLSNTPQRTKTTFLLSHCSVWSRKAPGHTGVGCPDPWWMQPVFWISCFTGSLPRTGAPWAPETCGWLHRIPPGTRTSDSCVWGCSEANCQPACPKTRETQKQRWLQASHCLN